MKSTFKTHNLMHREMFFVIIQLDGRWSTIVYDGSYMNHRLDGFYCWTIAVEFASMVIQWFTKNVIWHNLFQKEGANNRHIYQHMIFLWCNIIVSWEQYLFIIYYLCALAVSRLPFTSFKWVGDQSCIMSRILRIYPCKKSWGLGKFSESNIRIFDAV